MRPFRKKCKNLCQNDAKMVPKLVQNRSKIDANIDQQIDAKLKAEKSIKNRALERQGVAKGTSDPEQRQVSELDGP